MSVRTNPGQIAFTVTPCGRGLERDLLGQPEHRVLRRHVGGAVRADRHLARCRRDVDDAPRLALEHLADDLPDRVEVRVHVDAVVVLPCLIVVVRDRLVVEHAGAVDQHMDLTEFLARPRHRLLHLVPVAHVGRDRDATAPEAVELLGQFLATPTPCAQRARSTRPLSPGPGPSLGPCPCSHRSGRRSSRPSVPSSVSLPRRWAPVRTGAALLRRSAPKTRSLGSRRRCRTSVRTRSSTRCATSSSIGSQPMSSTLRWIAFGPGVVAQRHVGVVADHPRRPGVERPLVALGQRVVHLGGVARTRCARYPPCAAGSAGSRRRRPTRRGPAAGRGCMPVS